MSIQLLLKKLQDLEPWEEWQQSSVVPRELRSRSGRTIIRGSDVWCYNTGPELHLFYSSEDVYSFVERASVLGEFKAL